MDAALTRPLGARVSDLRVDALNDADRDELVGLLARVGVVVVPGQHHTDDSAFTRFLHSLGPMMFTVGETPVPDHPDLNVISNIGRATPPRSSFHVDTSYVARPPVYTALRAVDVPRCGGQTLFSDQYAAYDTLPTELRRSLTGCQVTHVVTGLDLGDDAETTARHPLFLRHPISARTALYLSTPQRCVAVDGMTPDESAAIVTHLYEHSTRETNLLRHQWAAGDVVIWDNRCVMHRADHSGVVGDRVMHRGMVAGPW
ncbi:TauD/TfdA dioxygenase family protein [Williamsia sterculiae]|uniref:Taurine dioxygenase n=1 Tax=Williamsia sterculiae TaxID=1344003 RepID=A0A1N7H5Y9_9NOCA|nr:TauD/TfdA family dioxygenase [Williamsia sterculiae]SIS20078.1 taurine dioxygenase [Williamsia sterculiae]